MLLSELPQHGCILSRTQQQPAAKDNPETDAQTCETDVQCLWNLCPVPVKLLSSACDLTIIHKPSNHFHSAPPTIWHWVGWLHAYIWLLHPDTAGPVTSLHLPTPQPGLLGSGLRFLGHQYCLRMRAIGDRVLSLIYLLKILHGIDNCLARPSWFCIHYNSGHCWSYTSQTDWHTEGYNDVWQSQEPGDDLSVLSIRGC